MDIEDTTESTNGAYGSVKPGVSQPDAFLTSVRVLFKDGTLSESTRITGCFNGVITVPILKKEDLSELDAQQAQAPPPTARQFLMSRNAYHQYVDAPNVTTEAVQIDHGYYIRPSSFPDMKRAKAFHSHCWDMIEEFRSNNPLHDNENLYAWLVRLLEDPAKDFEREKYWADPRIGGPVGFNQGREWTFRESQEWLLSDPKRIPDIAPQRIITRSNSIFPGNGTKLGNTNVPEALQSLSSSASTTLNDLPTDIIIHLASHFLTGAEAYRLASCNTNFYNTIMGALQDMTNSNMVWKSQCLARGWIPTQSLPSSFDWRAWYERCENSRSMRNRWRILRILTAWSNDM